jgi:hypothetical protein
MKATNKGPVLLPLLMSRNRYVGDTSFFVWRVAYFVLFKIFALMEVTDGSHRWKSPTGRRTLNLRDLLRPCLMWTAIFILAHRHLLGCSCRHSLTWSPRRRGVRVVHVCQPSSLKRCPLSCLSCELPATMTSTPIWGPSPASVSTTLCSLWRARTATRTKSSCHPQCFTTCPRRFGMSTRTRSPQPRRVSR